jgi:hypothetical protein
MLFQRFLLLDLHSCNISFINVHCFYTVGERGDSWHTFHVIIFHIFPVLVKLNIAARMASNTLGLQSDLHKFDAVQKK